MKVQASLKNYRRSAQKVREIVRVIRGMNALEAVSQLEYINKGGAPDLKKLVESAIANAENNFGLKKETLFITSINVDEGTKMKRFMPRAMGRAARILKRFCHVNLIVEDFIKASEMEKEEKPKAKEVKKEKPATKVAKKAVKAEAKEVEEKKEA